MDGLRRELPRALVGTVAAVAAAAPDPAPLLPCWHGWPVEPETADDLRVAAAAGVLDRVGDLAVEVRGLVESGRVAEGAERALTDLVPATGRLEGMLPHRRFRRAASVRDRAAVALNNTGVALAEDPGWRGRFATIEELYRHAAACAVDAELRDAVRANHDMVVYRAARASSVGTPYPRPAPTAVRHTAPGRAAAGAPYRGPASPRSGGLVGLAAVLAYLAAVGFLLIGVAAGGSAGIIVTVVGAVLTIAVIGSATRWRAVQYLVLAAVAAVPAGLLWGTGLVAGGGAHAWGYLAGLGLLLALLVLRTGVRR